MPDAPGHPFRGNGHTTTSPEAGDAHRAARIAVAAAVRAGTLKPGKCPTCGSTKTEAHHDDYSKPLDVTWHCTNHHPGAHSHKTFGDCPVCGMVMIKLYTGKPGCALHGPQEPQEAKGDVSGHAFHGNQYGIGSGQVPLHSSIAIGPHSHGLTGGMGGMGGHAPDSLGGNDDTHSHLVHPLPDHSSGTLKEHLDKEHGTPTKPGQDLADLIELHWRSPHRDHARWLMVEDEKGLFARMQARDHITTAQTHVESYAGNGPGSQAGEARDNNGRWTKGDGGDVLPRNNPMVSGSGHAHAHSPDEPTPVMTKDLADHLYHMHGVVPGLKDSPEDLGKLHRMDHRLGAMN